MRTKASKAAKAKDEGASRDSKAKDEGASEGTKGEWLQRVRK